jgi:hypothetical protein
VLAESRTMGFFPFSGFAIARPLKMRRPVRTCYLFWPYSVDSRRMNVGAIYPTRISVLLAGVDSRSHVPSACSGQSAYAKSATEGRMLEPCL